jgi:hypothetical protein
MIYPTDNGYTVSAYRSWLPGFYESKRAARNAFKLDDEVLQSLMDAANQRAGGSGGTITEADVRGALRDKRGKHNA